mmetsp:Transcript_15165/g.60938  ORF Transcript_15165/g.60938 Transcript_15165/m.60938 type:complete len:85 (-) Transcript_15165:39-293(-)
MNGHAAFLRLAVNAAIASAGLVASLHFLGSTLAGVWLSFGVFNSIRLIAAMHHHLFAGPLAVHKLKKLRHSPGGDPPGSPAAAF